MNTDGGVFVRHRVSRRGRGGGPTCTGSGWLVEDDEYVEMTPGGVARSELAAARRALARQKENV